MRSWAKASAAALALSAGFVPALSFAQSVSVTRSILPDQPYTLIYPEVMLASGGGDEPLVINHPHAPLQCTMSVVPVEDTGWTADSALASLEDQEIIDSWTPTFPGFAITDRGTVPYQTVSALTYSGTSTGSPQGVPIELVHTEAVDGNRGYVLDCFFATDVAEQAEPIVDFIIANFSTRSDAECCIGAEVNTEEPAVAPQP